MCMYIFQIRTPIWKLGKLNPTSPRVNGRYPSFMSAQSPLVTVEWLAQHLDDPHLVIFDASTGEFRHGPDVIPGARDFDIDGEMSDLSAPLPHTMPSAAQFQHAARAQGLNEDSLVVVYDAQGIYSSPRAWWMLKSMGAQEVYILSGGLPAWRRAGYPVVARTDAAGDVVPGIVKLRGSAHRAVQVVGRGRIVRVDSGGDEYGTDLVHRHPSLVHTMCNQDLVAPSPLCRARLPGVSFVTGEIGLPIQIRWIGTRDLRKHKNRMAICIGRRFGSSMIIGASPGYAANLALGRKPSDAGTARRALPFAWCGPR